MYQSPSPGIYFLFICHTLWWRKDN